MECTSFTAHKTHNHHHTQSFSDDFTAVIGVSGDDLFVDGLLDFSDDGDFEQGDDTHVVLDTNNDENGYVSPVKMENNDAAAGLSALDDRDADLCLPADDVADLEWVSHFVDDSFSSGYSLTCPTPKFPKPDSETKPQTGSVVTISITPAFTTSVVTKARTKRGRTGGRVRPVGTGQPADSSASSSSSSSFTNTRLLFNEFIQTAESVVGKFKVKRQKKGNSGPVQPRRCSHCLVQKTPQWRTGPLGAKTLCNACGVRYKSGRLLPEYRPACSPTFSSEVHSNNHRKVLEMRQKKEEGDVGVFLPVRSF